MKQWLLLALTVLLVCTAFACGQKQEAAAPVADTPAPTAAPTNTPEPTATPTPTPVPTPTPTPKVRSLTSGRVIPEGEEWVNKPVIVSIENSKAARPQTGLNQADIVYEFGVESMITRFQALFNDTYPQFVGPVRSARYYFIKMQKEWASMYIHVGYGPPSGEYKLNEDDIVLHMTSGGITAGTRNSNYFWRTDDQKAREHTLMVNLAQAVADKAGELTPPRHQRFLFDEGVTYDGAQKFSRIHMRFTSNQPDNIEYAYDPATNLLSRFELSVPFMVRTPAETGKTFTVEPLSVQNLIIQYAKYSFIKNDNKGRRMVEMIGTGKCDYFVNGQHVTGYWERPTEDEPTTYYLDSGEIVTLEPGNTWIAVYPDDPEKAIVVDP